MEFLGKLGIDINMLLAQLVNFGLLLWLLKKFLYVPVIKMIEDDERELNEAREEKKKIDQESSLMLEQGKKEIKDARERSKQIVSEAEDMAENIKKNAQEETELEKNKTIEQIRSRLKEIENDKR